MVDESAVPHDAESVGASVGRAWSHHEGAVHGLGPLEQVLCLRARVAGEEPGEAWRRHRSWGGWRRDRRGRDGRQMVNRRLRERSGRSHAVGRGTQCLMAMLTGSPSRLHSGRLLLLLLLLRVGTWLCGRSACQLLLLLLRGLRLHGRGTGRLRVGHGGWYRGPRLVLVRWRLIHMGGRRTLQKLLLLRLRSTKELGGQRKEAQVSKKRAESSICYVPPGAAAAPTPSAQARTTPRAQTRARESAP